MLSKLQTRRYCAILNGRHETRHRPDARCRRFKHGFTLMELLVVIAVIALLMSILAPSLQNARELAKRVVCSSRMRQWAIATNTYSVVYDGAVPFKALDPQDSDGIPSNDGWWYDTLAPFLSDKPSPGFTLPAGSSSYTYLTNNYYTKMRQCPKSKRINAPYQTTAAFENDIYFSPRVVAYTAHGDQRWRGGIPRGPFNHLRHGTYRGRVVKLSKISMPSDLGAFFEGRNITAWSPFGRYPWSKDYDGDFDVDSFTNWAVIPYSLGRPKIHSDGSNVALMDSHVEYVKKVKLWEVDNAQKPVHQFWKMRYN